MRPLTVPILLCAALSGVACADDPVAPAAPLVIEMNPGASGNGQSAEVGSTLPLPLRVKVTRAGQPVEGVVVSWAAGPGNGTVGSASTTNANGVGAVIWVLPTSSGSKSATATLVGAEGSPITFTATANPGQATSFSIFGGNNQTVSVGAAAGLPLAVLLQDQHGNPIVGVDVEWVLVSGSAVLSATGTVTGVIGSTFIDVTGGATPGPAVIRAIPDVALPSLDFNLTVVP